MDQQTADVDITHRLHGLLPSTQQGMISIYRALKQRPKTGNFATRFDIPVTLDTAPGMILRDIYDLWSDLAKPTWAGFQLIPILHRSLHLLHRPLSDPAYLLVLSRSLEMKQRAHCLLHICWDDRRWTTATILPAFLQLVHPARTISTRSVSLNWSENGCLSEWRPP